MIRGKTQQAMGIMQEDAQETSGETAKLVSSELFQIFLKNKNNNLT